MISYSRMSLDNLQLPENNSGGELRSSISSRQQNPQRYLSPTKTLLQTETRQLFEGEVKLNNDVRVSFSAQASNQYKQMSEMDSLNSTNKLTIIPRFQNFDEKLQFSVDFQFGNQKQSINFDIDIHNLIQENNNDQNCGKFCSCIKSQTLLTKSKLQELDDPFSAIQYGLLRQKMRKGSCNSDFSDVTQLNDSHFKPHNYCHHHQNFQKAHPFLPQEELPGKENVLTLISPEIFDNSKLYQSQHKPQLIYNETNHKKSQQDNYNNNNNINNENNNNNINNNNIIKISEFRNNEYLIIEEKMQINLNNQCEQKISETEIKYRKTQDKELNNQDGLVNGITQNCGNVRTLKNSDRIEQQCELELNLNNYDSNILSKEDFYKIIEDQLGQIPNLSQQPSMTFNTPNNFNHFNTQSQELIITPIKKLNNYQNYCSGKSENLGNDNFFTEQVGQGLLQQDNQNQMQIHEQMEFNPDKLFNNLLDDIEYTKEYLAKAEKKNVVKNFVKAFKSYLNEDENKAKVIELLNVSTEQELDSLKKKFTSYLKKKKFNNKLIKDLLMSQSYSKVFEFWLLNSAKDWLYSHSKVENKQSHFIMLKFFISCIEEPDQLDKLKVLKDSKKSYSTLFSAHQTQTNYNNRIQYCEQIPSLASNQNTYTNLDSKTF